METIRTINPIQLHLLEMFRYSESEQMMSDLKDVLADFYAKQVQQEAEYRNSNSQTNVGGSRHHHRCPLLFVCAYANIF